MCKRSNLLRFLSAFSSFEQIVLSGTSDPTRIDALVQHYSSARPFTLNSFATRLTTLVRNNYPLNNNISTERVYPKVSVKTNTLYSRFSVCKKVFKS